MPSKFLSAGTPQSFHDLAGRHPGRIATLLRLAYPDGHSVLIEMARSNGIDPTPAFLAEAEQTMGAQALRFVPRREICLKPRPERRWPQRWR